MRAILWVVYLVFVVAGAAVGLVLYLAVTGAHAQHNHHRGHNDYLGWSSGKTPSCCNNQDCGTIPDDDVRQTPEQTQIRIDGQWCPVLREHWLIRGRSPDWSSFHGCIGNSPYWMSQPPCERLLCFSGKGGV